MAQAWELAVHDKGSGEDFRVARDEDSGLTLWAGETRQLVEMDRHVVVSAECSAP